MADDAVATSAPPADAPKPETAASVPSDGQGSGAAPAESKGAERAGSAQPESSGLQVTVTNLGKWASKNQADRVLRGITGVDFEEVSKAKKSTFAVVTFRDLEEKARVVPLILATKFKGRNLGVRPYEARSKPRRDNDGDDRAPKKRKTRPWKLQEGVDGVWRCLVCGALNTELKGACHRASCAAMKGTPAPEGGTPVLKDEANKRARHDDGVVAATVAAGIEWRCPSCGRYCAVGFKKCTADTCGKPRFPEDEDAEHTIHDTVTPWAHLPYELQLKCKQTEMDRTMVRLCRRLRKETVNVYKGFGHARKEAVELTSEFVAPMHEGKLCPLEPIVPSPCTVGYRNKCTFTIQRNTAGQVSIGFRWGSFQDTPAVGSALACVNVSPGARAVCVAMQRFLDTSPPEMFVKTDERRQYCWKQVVVRTSVHQPDVMVFITARNSHIDPELWASEVARLKKLFSEPLPPCTEPYAPMGTTKPTTTDNTDPAKEFARSTVGVPDKPVVGSVAQPPTDARSPVKVSSLLLQVYNGPNSHPDEDTPVELLLGDRYMTEKLMGYKFRVSPQSFFQVNTLGAEVLYRKVAEFAGLKSTPNAALVDVCCGTGTIGITLARDAKALVGVELCGPAVEDARENARLNNIDNAVFICDRAESVMKDVLGRADEAAKAVAASGAEASGSKDSASANAGAGGDAGAGSGAASAKPAVVAIVDPPRAGLMKSVLRALRTNHHLKRLVYVSCNPTKSFVNDAISLCTPAPFKKRQNTMAGPPFRLVRAIPVDMFPHTPHTELVALFERD